MEIIKGKTTEQIEQNTFHKIVNDYNRIVVDIGTGDGKFVYEGATKNKNKFYIGIDANRDALEKYSSKIYKKPSRGGIKNALYIITPIEIIPDELSKCADEIYINFPWGSLLAGVINCEKRILDNIAKLAKNRCQINMYFNYSSKYEPVEMHKLGIVDLTNEYILNTIIPNYKSVGINVLRYKTLSNEDIQKMNAQWGRRLGFGRTRIVWEIVGVIGNVNIKLNQPKHNNYSFEAHGHKNILATHAKTLEITKSNSVTERGDCIVAVRANFELERLKQFSGRVEVELKTDKCRDTFKCFINPQFSDNHELVFRKSKFSSTRTFGFSSTKSSKMLNRGLIQDLQNGSTLQITIRNKEKKVHVNKYKTGR